MDRREFLKRSGRIAMGAGGLYLAGSLTSCMRKTGTGEEFSNLEEGEVKEPVPVEPHAVELAVVRGAGAEEKLRAGLEALGGLGRFPIAGKRVLIKPNAAFANDPALATTTHPQLVAAMVRLLMEAGAASVLVFDHTLSDLPKVCLETNGIAPAATAAGAKVVAYAAGKPGPGRYINIPGGRAIQKVGVLNEVLDADFIVNMPKAKHHSGAGLSLSLKNLMGTLTQMGIMHQIDLHRAIAELNTVLKPGLVVLDATSVLLNKGPGGPGDVSFPDEVVIARDPVAVDSYATSYFGKRPEDIPSIVNAAGLRVGTMDYTSLGMRRIEL